MQMKKFIINADDFGYSKEVNEAVLAGYKAGNITSASLISNMPGYENAVFEVYPKMSNIKLGFHFNVVEGKSLIKSKLLCDEKGNFNNDFIQILLKSNNKNFMEELEEEFRAQIEKILKSVPISHIDSHRYIHAIPKVYELIVKLAKEYNIEKIRTQKEIPYFVFPKVFNIKIPANIVKNVLLNYLTIINSPNYKHNYTIGILYTGLMDEDTLLKGLEYINDEEANVEIIMHPSTDIIKKSNYKEYLTLKNPELYLKIQDLGFKF